MIQHPHRSSRVLSVGAIGVGFAVAIASFGVVRAEHAKPNTSVSYSCSTGMACVEGSSTGSGTWGVYGVGTKDDGVRGVTTTSSGGNGVTGLATGASTSANGLYGKSTNGTGVYGTSVKGYGVEGIASSTGGVEGIFNSTSPSGYGVFGTAPYGYGVYGSSTEGNGVYGAGQLGVEGASNGATGIALSAYSENSFAKLFYAYDAVSDGSCSIDGYADLSCTGTISGAAHVQIAHTNSQNRHVLAYASESATPTIEDLGAARMRDGVANVEIPADFASVIDRSNAYYVFLTPMGDTRGLYVSLQAASGFQVRENMHGHSSVEFEYRIVAVPIGAKNVRLPNAPLINKPRGVQRVR
jgi:hypothetical protein